MACSSNCNCGCRGFTSAEVAGRAGLRLSAMWDRARDMMSRAGLRPYQVKIVRARSTGQRQRGDGPTEIVGEWPLLPTPMVGDLTALSEMLMSDQRREQGTILLSEISLQYPESVLMGLGSTGAPIPAGEFFYYEIRPFDGSGRPTQARRFEPDSAPSYDATKAMWSITLRRLPWNGRR